MSSIITHLISISQRLYLAGKKITGISEDSTSARSPLNLIDEKAIKDYVDGAIASGGATGSGIIYGAAYWSGTGLVFNVTDAAYLINGIYYSSLADDVTLATADATNPRIDVIYLDTAGNVGVITGTPGVTPVKPQVDPATQVELSFVLVEAGATVPAGITNNIIYDENTESTGATDIASVNFAYGTGSFNGSVNTLVPAFTSAKYLSFLKPSTLFAADYQFLNFKIKLGAAFTNSTFLSIYLYNGNTPISAPVNITTGTHGFTRTIVGSWQFISIPISAFALSSNAFNKVYIRTNGSNVSGFQLDYMLFQAGNNTVVPSATTAQLPLVMTGSGKVSRRYNVSDYGALGNGIQDDTTFIQAAINACDAGGGGEVFFPLGKYIIAGARNTTYNSQLYIPVRNAINTGRNHIKLIGEALTSYLPTGGGLDISGAATMMTGTTVLYSTYNTYDAAGQAIIGTATPGGGFLFNENFLTVENLSFRVLANPSGDGPVMGGVNYKNGGSLNVINSSCYIDISGGVSVLPVNDVCGFEFPDDGAETSNSLDRTFVVGFRHGYKIAEHTHIIKSDAWCCYYAYTFKAGNHLSTGLLMQSYWCCYDFNFTGLCMVHVIVDIEWQNIGKWYDNITTVNDPSNYAEGNIFYCIRNAFGIGGTSGDFRFAKNGGTQLNTYAIADGFGGGDLQNVTNLGSVTSNPITIGNSAVNPYLLQVRLSNSDGSTSIPGSILTNSNTTAATGADYNFAPFTSAAGNGAVLGQFFSNYGIGASAPFNAGTGVMIGARSNHRFSIYTNDIPRVSVPANGINDYADNAAAIAAGLIVGDQYRTGDLLKIVH